MKTLNILVATIGLALAGAAYADNFNINGDVGVDSQNIYRGQILSKDVSANGRVRFDNVFLDGVFAEVSASTVNTSPLSDVRARTEVNVGWHGQWDRLGVEVSAARVFNTKLDYLSVHDYHLYNDFNYNEARAKVDYKLTDAVKVYGLVGQGFNNPNFSNHDYRYLVSGANTYLAAGVEVAVASNVTVGGLVSAEHYDAATNFRSTRYNNTEVYATVNLVNNLDLEGRYSFAGKNVVDTDVSNAGYVGLRYRF